MSRIDVRLSPAERAWLAAEVARLAAARKNAGLTQAQVAARIGCQSHYIGSWERQWSCPPIDAWLAWRRVLGVRAVARATLDGE